MLPDLMFRITAQGETASTFGKTRDQLSLLGKTMADVRREAGLAKSLLAGFGGGLGFGLISSIGEIPAKFREIVSEGAGLVSTAEHLGITTDELQKLRYAAQLAHVDIATLDSALEFFSKNTADAAAGGADRFRAALQLNGVALRDNQGRLRPLNDLFKDYLGVLSRAANQQDKNLLSMIGFGKGAAEMGDLATKGGDGIQKAGDELDRLGGVMSRIELEKMKEIDEAFVRTQAVLETFAKRSATAMINSVESITGGIDAISADLSKFEASPSWENLAQFLFGKNWRQPEASYPLDPGIAARRNQMDAAATYPEDPRAAALKSSTPYSAPAAKVPPPPNSELATLRKRYDDLTASLNLQLAALKETDREQFVAKEVAKLGTKATEDQKEAVAGLAGQLFDETKALKDFNEESQFFGDAIFQALDGILIKGQSAEEVLKNLVTQLAEAALQAAILGQGPLASLFGTAPTGGVSTGGVLGSLFKSLFGFAEGGEGVIGGTGGPDSQLFMAKVSPGEHFKFTPRGKGGGGDGGQTIRIVPSPYFDVVVDQRAAEVATPIARKTTQAGIGTYHRQMERQRALKG